MPRTFGVSGMLGLGQSFRPPGLQWIKPSVMNSTAYPVADALRVYSMTAHNTPEPNRHDANALCLVTSSFLLRFVGALPRFERAVNVPRPDRSCKHSLRERSGRRQGRGRHAVRRWPSTLGMPGVPWVGFTAASHRAIKRKASLRR